MYELIGILFVLMLFTVALVYGFMFMGLSLWVAAGCAALTLGIHFLLARD
jgi:hypothetical protein